MPKSTLPHELSLADSPTDRQIAQYIMEVCQELQMLRDDPKAQELVRILDRVISEAHRFCDEADQRNN